MLGQLANNAMQGVITEATSNNLNEQSAAVGTSNVGGWLGRMIGEMENLSLTPASTETRMTAPSVSVLNCC